MSFGVHDTRASGYEAATKIARAAGYEPVVRLAGGRAAAYDGASLSFAWAIPDDEARAHIHERYEELAAIVVAVLRGLNVDARSGEVSG